MILAASQLLWFASTGGLWVVLGYLLVAFSLGTIITVDMLVRALAVLRHTGRYMRWLYPTAIILLFAVIVESRWFTVASQVLQLHTTDRSTTVEVGRWAAQAGIPKASHIVYDDLAYFDPQLFPNSRMHGGVLTWPALRKLQPELIVLSSTIYEASWYAELRRTQHLSREDTYPFSMRLYQELVDYEIPGPTAIPGITLLKVIRPTSPPVFVLPSYIVWLQPHLTRLLGVDATQWVVARLSQHAAWMSYLAWLMRNALGLEHALIGPTLKVYQTDLTAIHGPGLSYDE
jgi:hypothetical protein